MLLAVVLMAVFSLAAIPAASACGGEGCTPGYWKVDQHLDDWGPTGYDPDDDFDTTFGVDWFDPDVTLLEALWMRGGKEKALARHGVAALLNASHPGIDYEYSAAKVMWLVRTGMEWAKNKLEYQNEMGCYF
jgi:hypothetical protein